MFYQVLSFFTPKVAKVTIQVTCQLCGVKWSQANAALKVITFKEDDFLSGHSSDIAGHHWPVHFTDFNKTLWHISFDDTEDIYEGV